MDSYDIFRRNRIRMGTSNGIGISTRITMFFAHTISGYIKMNKLLITRLE